MRFVIAIERGDDQTAFGVVVPDLPGCFSAGDTLGEAMTNAVEAIDAIVEAMIENGEQIPVPRPIEEHHQNPQFEGWVWAVVDAPVEKYFGPAEKINITVPKAILARIDGYAKAHGVSRSAFLVDAARAAMR